MSVAFFLLVMTASVLIVIYAPRKYASQAEYLVRLGHESVSLDPIATVGETMGLHMTADSVVRSTSEVIGSHSVAEKVVDRLGVDTILDRDPETQPTPLSRFKQLFQDLDPIPDREKAMVTLQDGLRVHSPNQTNVIQVSYVSPSPELAHRVMQALSDVFLEEHNRINRTAGAFEFFDEQNEVLLARLTKASETLKQAKQRLAVSSIEGKRGILESRMGETQAALSENGRRLASSAGRLKSLAEQLAVTPENVMTGETSGQDQQSTAVLRQQLYDLQIREKELLSRFTADHPKLQAVQQQLQEVSEIFAQVNLDQKQTSHGMNPLHQDLAMQFNSENANHAALTAASNTLREQNEKLAEALQSLAEQENEIFDLETQRDVAKAKFEAHALKLEQARLEHELGSKAITSIGVIEQPQLQYRPISPNKPVTLVLGFLVACFGAAVLPFALEYLKDDRQAARPLDEPGFNAAALRRNAAAEQAAASSSDSATEVGQLRSRIAVHAGHTRTREHEPGQFESAER
ncbi:MAG: GumC family protein [Novipirellula sp. JB048]